MDEARHVEAYELYLGNKLGKEYPCNPELRKLLDHILQPVMFGISHRLPQGVEPQTL